MIPKVSIIIPHWNGIETLSECLSSITRSDFKSYEVIVSDNNSTDGSQDWIRKNHPDVILIENKSNYGFNKVFRNFLIIIFYRNHTVRRYKFFNLVFQKN